MNQDRRPTVEAPADARAASAAWIVLPTYNERENLPVVVAAIHRALPEAKILVVDDGSPDGTGRLADELASADPLLEVMHRTEKNGLGAAYRAGFAHVLGDAKRPIVVQMDCDLSHDPNDLPRLIHALTVGADLAIGSRYVPGGSIPDWDIRRRLISRGGSLFARTVLGLRVRDLTGGFKAWRAPVLKRAMAGARYAQGYGFQVEMTWRAIRSGATVTELPIVFRDRVAGESKMSGAIVIEAMLMVLRLRLDAWRGRV